eukprot:gene7659-11979_t
MNRLETETENDEEKIALCLDILESHIFPDSKEELDVSLEIKDRLIVKFEEQIKNKKKWILPQTPIEIFYPLKKILLSELGADNFARFVRSKMCREFIGKYEKEPGVMKKKETGTRYKITDENFNSPFISKSELAYMNEIFTDSFVWEQIYGKKHFNMYFSKTNFLPQTTCFPNSVSMKYQTILPHSFDKVVGYFLSRNHLDNIVQGTTAVEIDKKFLVENSKREETITQNYSLTTNQYIIKQFPFNTPRKGIDVHSLSFNQEENSLVFIKRPYFGDFEGDSVDAEKKIKLKKFIMPNGEKKDVNGYLIASVIMMKFEILSNFLTKVSFVTTVSPKGLLSQKVMERIFKITASSMEQQIIDGLKMIPSDYSIQDDVLDSEPLLVLLNEIIEDMNTF